MQDIAVQHWWYSTTLVANAISHTGRFSKMIQPDFIGEDVGGNLYHSDSEKL